MKINITEYFIKRPIIFWSLMISILIAGLLSFIQMPKLEDPAVAVKQAMVVVRYPGASAHEVELEAVQIIEDNLRTLPDVKKIKSECFNGQALIAVEFEMTVLLEDCGECQLIVLYTTKSSIGYRIIKYIINGSDFIFGNAIYVHIATLKANSIY